MSEKIVKIIDELKTLTLLEAAELVTEIEETFNVDASASTGNAVIMTNDGNQEKSEEKSEFDIELSEVPADKKIPILKVVRGITGLGLKEAKELVESAPRIIQEGIAKDVAEDAKKQIENAGGKVSLK